MVRGLNTVFKGMNSWRFWTFHDLFNCPRLFQGGRIAQQTSDITKTNSIEFEFTVFWIFSNLFSVRVKYMHSLSYIFCGAEGSIVYFSWARPKHIYFLLEIMIDYTWLLLAE